jgi:outer membrane protein TolC
MMWSNCRLLLFVFYVLVFPKECFSIPEGLTSDQEQGILMQEEHAVVLENSGLDFVADENLTLDDCLKISMDQNFDIKRAREEVHIGRGVKRENQSQALPKVLASSGYEKRDPDSLSSFNGGSFGSNENWSALAEVQQPLFVGGEAVSSWRRGELIEQAAQAGYEAVLNEVEFQVRERFYNALLARARVTVQQQSVELLEKQLLISRNRLEAGTIPRFNVLRAEVELANARTPLIRARNDLRLSLEELSQVLGVVHTDADKVEAAVRIRGSLLFEEPVYDLPGAIKTALQQRPELRQLELLAEAEQEGIDIERANYFPHLLAFAGYGWESSRFSDRLSDVDQGWRVGLRAEWDLFDGLRTQGRVSQALAKSASARVKLQQKSKDVTVEVRRAMSELLESAQLVKASKKVVEQAEEGLRQATARLDSGAGPQIDVLDTQVALTEARTNEIVSLHAFNVATASLQRATASEQ